MNYKKFSIFSVALNVVLGGWLIANMVGRDPATEKGSGTTDPPQIARIMGTPTDIPPIDDGVGPTVYVTPSGKRCHKQYCPTIQGHDVSAVSLRAAERAGKTPCKKCKPSEL